MLGLPNAGKTAFLAAFMYYLEAEIDNKNLTQYQLSPDSNYLAYILKEWLEGRVPERTQIISNKLKNKDIDIYLKDTATSLKTTLHIPDFHGEIFENQFADHLVDIEYIDQCTDVNGILLFIHPEKIKEPLLIEDVNSANQLANLIDEGFEEEVKTIEDNDPESPKQIADDHDDSEEISKFKVEDTPTQMVLSDLILSHLELLSSRPLRIAVIVSAWDVVESESIQISPTKWLQITLPLLYQFLVTNDQEIIFKCFGISAQGGNVKDPKIRAELIANPEPATRIYVREGEEKHSNIASPIEWLLKQ